MPTRAASACGTGNWKTSTNRFRGLQAQQTRGDWVLSANLGYFTAREDGDALLGNIDNQAFFSMFTARHGGHSFRRLPGHLWRQPVPTGIRQHFAAGQRGADL
jgi:hypothetical protein